MTSAGHRPAHHPSELLLAAYAGGTLAEAESLAVSAHLTLCPDCQRQAASAEMVGGALLERMEPAPVSGAALKSVLARLDDERPEAPAVASAPRAGDLPGLPRALSRYVDAALADAGWRMIGFGVQQLRLRTGGAAQARLLRLKPGTPLPEHGHSGLELTVLLAGSYSDELGHFARGDMVELDESVRHRPIVDGDATCVALVVTDAPLKFSGLMARLARPIIGF